MIKGVIIPKVITPGPRTTQMTPALEDAAAALEALAAGETPDRTAALLVAAQHLDTLCTRGLADCELLDAAAGLKAIATGGVLTSTTRDDNVHARLPPMCAVWSAKRMSEVIIYRPPQALTTYLEHATPAMIA